jgi:putative nucleotidyltransferase with HDIG domain
MELHARDMVTVPIELILPGLQIQVDMFISLSDDRFVLIFRAGSPIDAARIADFHARKIKALSIRKVDYPKFMERQLTVAGILIDYKKVPIEQKTGFLNSVVETLIRELDRSGFNGESYETAKRVARAVLHLVESEPSLYAMLQRLHENSDVNLKHSMGTGMIATMIAQQMSWTRTETLEKLALGGMLHDIGKNELPPQILSKERFELSYEELKEYESHPFRGMQMLQSIPIVPADIIAIVYEHHENSIGQGYPRRLWDMRINPLARVTALSNCFAELILESNPNHPPRTPHNALLHIEAVMGQPFNKDTFKALRAIIAKMIKVPGSTAA